MIELELHEETDNGLDNRIHSPDIDRQDDNQHQNENGERNDLIARRPANAVDLTADPFQVVRNPLKHPTVTFSVLGRPGRT